MSRYDVFLAPAAPEPEAATPPAPSRYEQFLPAPPPDTAAKPTPGLLANAPGDEDLAGAGLAKNLATGAVRGVGAGVDNARLLTDAVPNPAAGLTSIPQKAYDLIMGQGAYEKGMAASREQPGAAGAVARAVGPAPEVTGEDVNKAIFEKTGEFAPTTGQGRMAQAATAGAVGSLLGPTGALAAPTALGKVGTAGLAAASGALGGGAGQAASEAASGLGPAASEGAGIVAGMLAGTAPYAVRAGLRGMSPTTTAEKAGDVLRGAADDPLTAARRLDDAGEIVPGSPRVAATASRDRGLEQFERDLRTADPLYKAQVLDAQDRGHTARAAALNEVQPAGNPAAVRESFASSLRALTAAHDDAVNIMRERAGLAADAIGTSRGAEAVGPELHGILARRYAAAKRLTNRLYGALEAKAGAAMPVEPLKRGMTDAYGTLTPEEMSRITPNEHRIRKFVGEYEDTVPFKRLRALDTTVNDALAAERRSAEPNSAAVRRLSMMKSAIEEAYADAAAEVAAKDAALVSSGKMKEQDSFQALLEKLTRESNEFLARTDSEYRLSGGADPAGSPRRIPAADYGAGAPGGGSTVSGDAAGVQGQPGPQWTDSDRAALRAANAQRRAQGNTFERGSVGQALQNERFANDPKMAPERVPGNFFKPGPAGAQSMREFQAAAGPRGAAPMADYIVDQMRAAAVDADGIVQPARLDRFLAKHRHALDQMPELRDRMRTAAGATTALEEAAAARAAALSRAQESLAGKLLGLGPDNTKGIGDYVVGELKTPKGRDSMRELMARLGDDADAVEGARRAVLERIMRETGRSTGGPEISAVNPQQFKRFLSTHRDALGEVFTPAQMDAMGRIADDLTEYQRWYDANKLPGGPNTATDFINAMARRAREGEPMTAGQGLMAGVAVGGLAGPQAGIQAGLIGAGLAWAQNAWRKMRANGLHKVDDVLRAAMLDPKLAAELLRNAPPPGTRKLKALNEAIARNGVFASGTIQPPIEEDRK